MSIIIPKQPTVPPVPNTNTSEDKRFKGKFEITPGIIISKLDLKEDDTIVVTIDPAQINLDDSYNVWLMMKKNFPLHNILTTFKGVDITIGDKE